MNTLLNTAYLGIAIVCGAILGPLTLYISQLAYCAISTTPLLVARCGSGGSIPLELMILSVGVFVAAAYFGLRTSRIGDTGKDSD
jgi:hypothetical protein